MIHKIIKNKITLILIVILMSSCKSLKQGQSTTFKIKSEDGKEWTTKGFISEGFYDDRSGGQVIPMNEYVVTPVEQTTVKKKSKNKLQ
jgi:hypothetical protein